MLSKWEKICQKAEEITKQIDIELVFDEYDLNKILDKDTYNSVRNALFDTIQTVIADNLENFNHEAL